MKSPVLENCTPGSVRGALGNQRPYLAKIKQEWAGTADKRQFSLMNAQARH